LQNRSIRRTVRLNSRIATKIISINPNDLKTCRQMSQKRASIFPALNQLQLHPNTQPMLHITVQVASEIYEADNSILQRKKI